MLLHLPKSVQKYAVEVGADGFEFDGIAFEEVETDATTTAEVVVAADAAELLDADTDEKVVERPNVVSSVYQHE